MLISVQCKSTLLQTWIPCKGASHQYYVVVISVDNEPHYSRLHSIKHLLRARSNSVPLHFVNPGISWPAATNSLVAIKT